MSPPRPAALLAALLAAAALPLLGAAPAQGYGDGQPARSPSGDRAQELAQVGAPGTVTPTLYAGTGEQATADDDEPTPLNVRLLSLTPSAIPQRGKVVLRGTVTNETAESWHKVNVLPFVSSTPITDRSELAEQAATAETAEVAERIIDPTLFDSLGTLAPGQTRSFRLALPRKKLQVSLPGVYWIGAHALGETRTQGRDNLADGRVRTFIPLVPRGTTPTSAAVVLPVREEVQRALDGRVDGQDVWADRLSEKGALGRLLDFAEASGSHPFTWLIDPAVLDAVADLAHGNPALSLGKPKPEQGQPTEPADPSQSPSGSSEGSGAGSDAGSDGGSGAGSGGAGTVRLTASAEDTAASWLRRLVASTRAQSVLGLGYADPDVSALARLKPSMLIKAERLAQTRFAAHDIDAEPAVAPVDGWLSSTARALLAGTRVAIVSDHGHSARRTIWRLDTDESTSQGGTQGGTEGGTEGGAVGSDRDATTTLVVSDTRAARGGPAPSPALGALALRQRVLADAALRALDGTRSPMPVVLPSGWDPGPGWQQAAFFDGLDQPWLRLVALDGSGASTPSYRQALPYPERARQAEIHGANVSAASAMINLGAVYDALLDTTNDVFRRLVGSALGTVSYHARTDELGARTRIRARTLGLDARLAQVKVLLGTDFVTLSGGEGIITVSLANDLPQPVRVGVSAHTTDPGLTIAAHDPVRIGPGERVAVRLRATATSIGVHEVTLSPVTADGRPVGDPLSFNLRTSQVGRLIWIILIGVSALLAVTIVLRITHRIRSHRWRK